VSAEAGAGPGSGAALPQPKAYGSGARILSVGIAATGILTFTYFSLASHVLSEVGAKRLDLLWSVMFVIISVIYRPIEQLLSRTIADRRARGLPGRHPLRVPLAIQTGFAALFLVVALALRDTVQNHVLDRSSTLYWVLVVGVLAYAASYFARGWLAGHQYFGLYGGLVLMEALSRVAFALAVAVGIAEGQDAVALGIAAAPFLSLVVVPWVFARRRRSTAEPAGAAAGAGETGTAEAGGASSDSGLSLRHGSGFAVSVAGIMLAEQAILNAAVLFQSIQTSLLPHLAGLQATDGRDGFGRAIRMTLLAILGFSAAVALGLLVVGPPVMSGLFGQHFSYDRVGLAMMGLGMGLHLAAGTLNQAALARGRAALAAGVWLVCAAALIAWLAAPTVSDQLLRAELGYFGATGLLALGLGMVYRLGARGQRT